MDINAIKCNIHNKFDIEVIDGKTGEIKEKAEAYNMVLDNLWHYIIETTTAFGNAIQYGSGTGTISASDTSLFNRVNGISVTQDSLTCDYINKVITRRCHINLGLTTSVGVNITEVGLAANTGNGTLTTHAILQDMNGNPISIAKTEFDIINIYATIYCHWTVTDPAITFYPRNGMQTALVGSGNPFGSFTGGVTYGTLEVNDNVTWSKSSYSLASKTITYTLPRYSQSQGNINGIGAFMGTSAYDGLLIRKGSNTFGSFTIQNESVGVGDGTETVFQTKISCPYNATVYINGVAQSAQDVTVLRTPLVYANLIPIANESTDGNLIILSGEQSAPCLFYNADYDNGGGCGYFLFSDARGSYGITGYVSVSNDLINWIEDVASVGLYPNGSGWVKTHKECTIPDSYHHYKYFKVYLKDSGSPTTSTCRVYNAKVGTSNKNIFFNTPPADGDVITIDYTTDCIPKDSDHVLDATVTFQFGDYTPSP